MNIKNRVKKLQEKINETFTSDSLKKLQETAKCEDPLGYGALSKSLNRLIEKNQSPTNNENDLKYQDYSLHNAISLDTKVDKFIKWYKDSITKEKYSSVRVYRSPIDMRNFIEKIAVWYELRYPDYEIDRIFNENEETKINNVMFEENKYFNNSETKNLNWTDFCNTKAFINSLPEKEKRLFSKPKYNKIVYWDYLRSSAYLLLSSNGLVTMSEYMDQVIPGITSKDLENKNIKDVVKIIEDRGIYIPENNEFIKAIKNYEKEKYQKEEMLNCAMYRIIERGGNRYGPKRAFIFAKEFKRNIDIPMIYGIDRCDPNLRKFINEYLKSGGSKDLICYEGYFFKSNKNDKLYTVSIQELLLTQSNNIKEFYTIEEKELHQKLVNILSSQIDQNVVKQEEIKQLRLQRKLKK